MYVLLKKYCLLYILTRPHFKKLFKKENLDPLLTLLLNYENLERL